MSRLSFKRRVRKFCCANAKTTHRGVSLLKSIKKNNFSFAMQKKCKSSTTSYLEHKKTNYEKTLFKKSNLKPKAAFTLAELLTSVLIISVIMIILVKRKGLKSIQTRGFTHFSFQRELTLYTSKAQAAAEAAGVQMKQIHKCNHLPLIIPIQSQAG